MSVNPKWRLFVKHYLALGSHTEAAQLAGYSAQYGSQLLKKDAVQQLVREGTSKDTTVADLEERKRYLTAVMRGVDYYDPADPGEEGHGVRFGYRVDMSIEPKDRLKACEMLSKIAGDFSNEKDEGTTNNVVLLLPAREQAEGRRLAGGGRRLTDGAIEAEFENVG